jgi:hypothetical protein
VIVRAWQFICVILVALVAGLAFAHLLESPAKLQYPGELYATLQRTLYVQWGPPNIGGWLEPAAILAAVLLCWLVRRERRAFRLTLLASVSLLLAFPVVFFWLVAPANAAFRGTVGDPLPGNWSLLRRSWELGHALRFGLQLVGLGALVASVVWRDSSLRPPGPPRASAPAPQG